MSSTSMASLLVSASKRVTIYSGMPILVMGIIGGFLNITVLLSLRTFRQNSCACYLTIMSIFSIGQLFTGFLSRILINGFTIDWTQLSLFYCKFRPFLFQLSGLTTCTCFCLATIDQYLATCSRPRWQKCCNIKFAQRLIIIFIFLWLLHGISYLIYLTHLESSSSTTITCASTSSIFTQYSSIFFFSTLTGFLPIFITVLFGLLAYHNIQTIAHRTIPLVRRELDKQLTVMVLTQVMINTLSTLPYAIMNIILLYPKITDDPLILAIIRLISAITLSLYYASFATPFYIYVCVSQRFRRQLSYVLFEIYLKKWKRPRIGVNQVLPQITANSDKE